MRIDPKRRKMLEWVLPVAAGTAAGVLVVVLLSTASLSGTHSRSPQL